MVDSHGQASDMVDENQAASPTVSPTLSIPFSLEQPRGMNGLDHQKPIS